MGEQYTDILESNELTLLDTIDHVLNRGLVISGDIVISVADIELIYLGLNVVLGSVETISRALGRRVETEKLEEPVNDSTGAGIGPGDV
jgi:hypothetical protein